MSERVILAAKNKDVDELNATIQMDIGGQLVSYNSVNAVMNQDDVICLCIRRTNEECCSSESLEVIQKLNQRLTPNGEKCFKSNWLMKQN